MLRFPSAIRIFFCTCAVDMRKGFDGLSAIATEVMNQDPLSGHVFVFRNRRGDRVKVLYWDRDGYAIWYKRLEKGRFSTPSTDNTGQIDSRLLAMMLEGMDLKKLRKRPRYQLKKLKNKLI
jgi:transposase